MSLRFFATCLNFCDMSQLNLGTLQLSVALRAMKKLGVNSWMSKSVNQHNEENRVKYDKAHVTSQSWDFALWFDDRCLSVYLWCPAHFLTWFDDRCYFVFSVYLWCPAHFLTWFDDRCNFVFSVYLWPAHFLTWFDDRCHLYWFDERCLKIQNAVLCSLFDSVVSQ